MDRSLPRPRFFCESCGAEVPGKAAICPRCGRIFTSVKCPRCLAVGKADEFAHGCPSCGYKPPGHEGSGATAPPSAPDEGLPVWVWILVGSALLVSVLALVLFLGP